MRRYLWTLDAINQINKVVSTFSRFICDIFLIFLFKLYYQTHFTLAHWRRDWLLPEIIIVSISAFIASASLSFLLFYTQ